MNTLLRTKLKLLVECDLPINRCSIDINAKDAKYILTLMDEHKALQKYSDSADEEHFEEVSVILTNVNNTNKKIN